MTMHFQLHSELFSPEAVWQQASSICVCDIYAPKNEGEIIAIFNIREITCYSKKSFLYLIGHVCIYVCMCVHELTEAWKK